MHGKAHSLSDKVTFEFKLLLQKQVSLPSTPK